MSQTVMQLQGQCVYLHNVANTEIKDKVKRYNNNYGYKTLLTTLEHVYRKKSAV